MYARILVPLDGSNLTEAALPYAEELAGMLGSEVVLTAVYELAESQFQHMAQIYIERMAELVKQHVEEFRQKGAGPGVRVESAILFGEPAEEIIGYAERNDISLIVMSTHGRSDHKRWALGSMADRVLRGATTPVFLVRPTTTEPEVRKGVLLSKILVALDGSEAGEATLPYVEELAAKLKARVILLQVVAPGQHVHSIGGVDYFLYPEQEVESLKVAAKDYLEKVGRSVAGLAGLWSPVVRAGDAAHEIIGLADEANADLVAISTHGRSHIRRWPLGGVADKILRAGNTPVMLVRVPEQTQR